jgi:hypothetical protein
VAEVHALMQAQSESLRKALREAQQGQERDSSTIVELREENQAVTAKMSSVEELLLSTSNQVESLTLVWRLISFMKMVS